MSSEVMVRPDAQVQAETLEKVLLGGNLAALSPVERMTYYRAVCESVGLNPLTRPFEYLTLNGKMVLYARREATEQLRKIHGVSIGKLEKTFKDDLYIVEAPASDKSGRTDASTGAVNLKGLTGEALANALMKCETKAKRRVTLSICGLGMLDETEVDSIRGAVKVPLDLAPGELDPDAPTVDLRADIVAGDRTPTAGGGTLPSTLAPVEAPRASVSVPEASQGPPKKDYPFLREMKRQKERVGLSQYYAVLGLAGYEHADEIPHDPEKKLKKEIFKALQAVPSLPQGEQGELGGGL